MKVAKLAQGYKNYAAPPSCGRASAWYVLPEALDLDSRLPPAKTHSKTINLVIFSDNSSLSAVGQEDALQKHTHSQRMLCLVRPVDSSSDAEWGDMGG